MKQRVLFLTVGVCLLMSCNDHHAIPTSIGVRSPSEGGSISKEPPLKFFDDFETDERWGIFEEIVGGSHCYGEGIGEVTRSRDLAGNGKYSLRVWANKSMTGKNNHVIGQKKVSDSGQSGRWRYQLRACIAPGTAGTGQAGPEFSIQNTRPDGLAFLTSTAGIQYRSSPYEQHPGSWAIWQEVQPGLAGWHLFLVQPLTSGKWYNIVIEADYDANRYGRFRLNGDGIEISVDLSSYSIARENKGFHKEALWITLESENLWNNCGTAGSFAYVVYYDQVKLHQLGGD